MLVGAGGDAAAVGQDHVHRQQTVNGQAEAAGEMPDSATEGEAADAGRGDDAARHRQAEGLRSVVNVAPGTATLDLHGASIRVYPDTSHGLEVNH